MIIIALVFLLAGAAIRVLLIRGEGALSGDAALRYDPIARNVANGYGFSRSPQAPYVPDDFDQPIYPLFIAAVYKLFNFSIAAVRLIQAFFELATLWLVYRITVLLEMPRRIGMAAVLVGIVCPFVPLFASRLLTEALATFILALTGYLLLVAKKMGGGWWIIPGLSAGTGLLTRPDLLISLTLMVAGTLLMTAGYRKWNEVVPALLAVALGTVLIMLPWCYRNYATFGRLRPLGGVTAQASLSYVKWLGTWVDDPKYQQDYWWGVWNRGKAITFPADKLTAEQIYAANRALQIAGAQGNFEGEPDRIFNDVYRLARQKAPLKVVLWLPVKRTAMAWVRMPGYLENPKLKYAVYAFWLPFLLLSATGLAVLYRGNRLAFMVLGGWVAGRAILPIISVLAIEPRYQIESLPAVFIFGAVIIEWMIMKRITRSQLVGVQTFS